MKVLIIEDEKFGFDNICRLLKETNAAVGIEGPVTSVRDMKLAMLYQENYDIIFSDIRLEDGLCFEALSDIELTTPLIFPTAYDEYALNAFQAGGISYLLKPIDGNRFQASVERALQMKRGCQNIDSLLQSYGALPSGRFASRLVVKCFDGACVIPVSSINHIVFEDDKVIAYTNDCDHFILADRTLDTLSLRLDPQIFFRVNRRFIVHIDAISKIHVGHRHSESVELRVYDNLRISISKERVPSFHDWIEHA